MSDGSLSTETAGAARSAPGGLAAQRLVTVLAVVGACAFVGLLGVRTLTTPDLGYHLAYGEHFLDRWQIVDTSRFLHDDAVAAGPSGELPPGAWFDASGAYRFPNANWLSQVVMALVHRWAGLKGLSVLLAVLVGGIFAVSLVTMRRLGLGWLAVTAGLLLTAMVAYERFLLRPEVFAYLVLMGQVWLLSGVGRGNSSRGPRPAAKRGEERPGRVIGWGTAAGLVGLQWLLVNLHSYFLLGIGLTGAVLAEALVRRLWSREAGGRGVVRLAVVLLVQVGVCFVNPWTWRLAVLPIQTLMFMRAHGIAGGGFTETGHPWAMIGEFFRPFAPGVFRESKASWAYCALLALSAAGVLCAAIRRRWAAVLIVSAMTAASLAMRRNIAPAALVVIPLSLWACRDALAGWAGRLLGRFGTAGALAAGGAMAAVSLYGAFSVVTHRFYRGERRAVRFGLGVSRTVVPVGAAEWLNAHRPGGRLWTDYNSSSNVMYFTRPHRPVPVLTNTWAYPPETMRRVLDLSRARRPVRGADGLD
ncbi:MAG TPA: hypothetical protein VFJ30_00045, partial [Phycisphaerae bacterium]|nr:hypothetical protein [Phycisphaerae bacterium]